ncbi:MAG: thioredoxin domain-containing protein [bacterium]|nr:thioredoxin domain-containing protein [bacterium]
MACALLIVSACSAQPAGDAADLQRQVDQLRKNQEATQEQLSELIERLGPLLDRLPKPFRPQDVSVGESPTIGGAQAKVTVVEFSDLQCPFCLRHYKNTLPQIMKEYVDTGKVRYVAREFPLTNLHADAQRASQAALCAGKQDKYWEMRERIFIDIKNLGDADLTAHAQTLGIDMGAWTNCMGTDVYARRVEADLKDGQKLGINGTPAFAIGLTDPDDPTKFRATKLIEGAYPYEAFEAAFKKLLGE